MRAMIISVLLATLAPLTNAQLPNVQTPTQPQTLNPPQEQRAQPSPARAAIGCWNGRYELVLGVSVRDRHCGPQDTPQSTWKSEVVPMGTETITNDEGQKLFQVTYEMAQGKVIITRFEDSSLIFDVDKNLATAERLAIEATKKSPDIFELVSNSRFNYGGVDWTPAVDLVLQTKPQPDARNENPDAPHYRIIQDWEGYWHVRMIIDTRHNQSILFVAEGGCNYDCSKDWMNSLTIAY